MIEKWKSEGQLANPGLCGKRSLKDMSVVCFFSVTAAHSMMQKRLTSLVVESFGAQSYKKAMDCLTLLRAESIKVRRVKKESYCYCPVKVAGTANWHMKCCSGQCNTSLIRSST